MNAQRLSGIAVSGAVLAALAAMPGIANADVVGTNFESSTYQPGDIDGQGGWSKTGPFDSNIVATTGYPSYGFGSKALQISNFFTSGSFGDQTYTPSTVDEAGESAAAGQGMSGGLRQTQFKARFRIGVADPSDPAGTDRHVTVSPDRGDGSRMSYLRFEDHTDGVHVFFDDVNADDSDFSETDLGAFDRTKPHLVEISMDLENGPANDVVTVAIDGVSKITGGSWEQYYRLDPEQAPNGNQVPTVDSLLMRESGTTNAGQQGKGFLIDDIRIETTSPGAGVGPPGAPGAPGANGAPGSPGVTGATGPAGASTPASERDPNPVTIKTTTLHPDRKGRVTVRFACPKPAGLCDGRLGLGIGTKALGNSPFLVRGGTSGVVTIKFTRAGLKLAAKKKRVTVIVLSRDNAGTAATVTGSLRFKP
jgi:hypothetical protein